MPADSNDLIRLVGRRRFIKGLVVTGAAAVLQPILAACGRTGTPSGSSTAYSTTSSTQTSPVPSAAQRLMGGALAQAIQGSWNVYYWETRTPDSPSLDQYILPNEVSAYAVLDPQRFLRHLSGLEEPRPPLQLVVGDGSFSLTGIEVEFSTLFRQVGMRDAIEGTWSSSGGVITLTLPLQDSETKYYSPTPVAAGLPDSVVSEDSGAFSWNFSRGYPGTVSYYIGSETVVLTFTLSETNDRRSEQHFLVVRADASSRTTAP